jgi:hypothetical protein
LLHPWFVKNEKPKKEETLVCSATKYISSLNGAHLREIVKQVLGKEDGERSTVIAVVSGVTLNTA